MWCWSSTLQRAKYQIHAESRVRNILTLLLSLKINISKYYTWQKTCSNFKIVVQRKQVIIIVIYFRAYNNYFFLALFLFKLPVRSRVGRKNRRNHVNLRLIHSVFRQLRCVYSGRTSTPPLPSYQSKENKNEIFCFPSWESTLRRCKSALRRSSFILDQSSFILL